MKENVRKYIKLLTRLKTVKIENVKMLKTDEIACRNTWNSETLQLSKRLKTEKINRTVETFKMNKTVKWQKLWKSSKFVNENKCQNSQNCQNVPKNTWTCQSGPKLLKQQKTDYYLNGKYCQKVLST